MFYLSTLPPLLYIVTCCYFTYTCIYIYTYQICTMLTLDTLIYILSWIYLIWQMHRLLLINQYYLFRIICCFQCTSGKDVSENLFFPCFSLDQICSLIYLCWDSQWLSYLERVVFLMLSYLTQYFYR